MAVLKKRSYNSECRLARSQATKSRILATAKALFEAQGFEQVTIDQLARTAQVSAPLIYALFQSKRGVLLSLMDEALAPAQHAALVEQIKQEKSPRKRLELTAAISRQLYEAESAQLSFLRGAAILDPVFKELELEREQRRYQRQKETTTAMFKAHGFANNLSLAKVRDLLWAFTGRDLYRMLVIERGWSPDEYEKWLAELLVRTLLK